MEGRKRTNLFNRIARIYSLFFRFQRRSYRRLLERTASCVSLSEYRSILDVGCGTGALSSVLDDFGFAVTGVDASEKMLREARRKSGEHIPWIQADVLKGLPFSGKSFDVSVCSFVAHGMKRNERRKLYEEMRRVTRHVSIIHDYNGKRSLLTDGIEFLEGGGYFSFVKEALPEMEKYFRDVEVIPAGKRSCWYVCTIPGGKPVTASPEKPSAG